MSLDVSYFAQPTVSHGRAARAIRFLSDPLAGGRQYAAEHSLPGYDPTYPFALGEALSTIQSLLDVAGFPVLGPDRFECEWALTHPWEAQGCTCAPGEWCDVDSDVVIDPGEVDPDCPVHGELAVTA